MSIRIQNLSFLSSVSLVAVLMFGPSARPALAQGCTTVGTDDISNGTVHVFVEWSKAIDPLEGSDYVVDFTNASKPDIELKEPDLCWVVYAKLVSGGAPADIGALTTPGDGNYKVQMANGGAAGFDDVGSASLVPTATHYSSILPATTTTIASPS